MPRVLLLIQISWIISFIFNILLLFTGSTALVALLDTGRRQLTVANVGDSRGILCDIKGTVIPLSFDHKPQQVNLDYVYYNRLFLILLAL